MSKEIDSHITQIFQIKKQLGSGAYGHVWKVVDRQSKKQLALKKIFDAFHNDVDAQRTYRQITILHSLDHYNIIKLHRVLKAKNNRDLYLVFDYMQADLQSLVGQQILEDVHIRFVIYQILKALKYLHSAQLVHRDLKPSNVLINSECQVKLCDFGLVRSLMHQVDQDMVLTQEVATRWYRSPEILLGSKRYGKETDIWSVGCIIAQLIMGQPIFPGDSTIHQLQKILEFTGVPSKHQIDSIESEVAESLINQLSVNRKSNQDYFKKSSTSCSSTKQIICLIKKMLEFNPKKRITIQQALELDLFSQFRSHKNYEDICTKFIVPQLDDNVRLGLREYRKMIYCDIERRYPENGGNASGDRSFTKEKEKDNKRIIRSHHSLNRKKSSEHIKVLNSSVHSNQNMKKQTSCSFHQGDNIDKIKRMKKQWKRQNSKNTVSNQASGPLQNKAFTQIQNCPSSPNFNPNNFTKMQNYSNCKSNLQPIPRAVIYKQQLQNQSQSQLLTKVRSRKLLYKSKSRDKFQHDKPMPMEKKRVLR